VFIDSVCRYFMFVAVVDLSYKKLSRVLNVCTLCCAKILNKNENQDCLHDKAAIYLFRFMQFKTNGVVILFLSLE